MSIRTARSGPRTFSTVGILAMLMSLFVLAGPVAADHTINVDDHTLGQGFDNPCGSAAAVKINSTWIDADGENHTYTFSGIDLTLVLNGTSSGSDLDSVTIVSISGGAAASIWVHAGEGTLLQPVAGMVINPEKGISFILLCVGPLTPTLTLDKVTVNGDSSFGFTATGGFNQSLTGAAAPLLVSSSAGVYTITETVSAAQTTAGWTFTSVDCTGNALAETPSGSSVTVTVGANEDVTCTFTNSRTAQAQLGGNPTPIPTPVVRAATLASALPNTAMELPTAGISVGLLGLVTLLGLGYVARRNMIGIRNRR